MVLIHLVQHMTPCLADTITWSDVSQGWFWHSRIDWSMLAQYINPDVFAATRSFFNNFIKSGQLWALLIGLIIGYIMRGFTTYG